MTHTALTQGETFREGLTIAGLDPAAERIEITWRNSLGRQVKKWTLEDGITELSANNYAYHLTNLETLAIPGRGTWQIEVVSTALGVKKSFSGTYEIAKATNLTTETVVIVPTNFDRLQNIDFSVIDNPVLDEWVEEFVRVAGAVDAEAAAAEAAASAAAADAARDEAVLVAGNVLTLVSYTDTTVTMGIGGSVTIEEGPSIYPSTSITFL